MSVLFLYAGSVNHWVCVSSNDSKTINLLDSLNVKITRSLLLQIASVFKPDKAASKLYINRLCVHQQSGTLDCGLFAIAFAVEICRGNNPREVEFVQTKMRDHLLTCLELRRFELFPRKKCQLKNKLARDESKVFSTRLYCFCRYPETYDKQMVECSSCKEWYHFSCIGVSTRDVEGNWLCSRCCGCGDPEKLGKPSEFSPLIRSDKSST